MTRHEIRTIAVIGAGLMGHGIAQEFALNGYAVRLHARTDESLSRATQRIRRNLSSLADDRRIDSEAVRSAMRNIGADTSLERTVDRVDVVIESVFEDLALKAAAVSAARPPVSRAHDPRDQHFELPAKPTRIGDEPT